MTSWTFSELDTPILRCLRAVQVELSSRKLGIWVQDQHRRGVTAHAGWLKRCGEERAIHGPWQTPTGEGGHRERRVAAKETEGTIREVGGELKGTLDKEFVRRVSNVQNGGRDHYCQMLQRCQKKRRPARWICWLVLFGDLDSSISGRVGRGRWATEMKS